MQRRPFGPVALQVLALCRLALGAAALAALPLAGPRDLSAQTPERARSLPRFDGTRIDGGRASTDLFKGRRGLLLVFSSSDPHADAVAGIVAGLESEASASNVGLLGVSRDQSPLQARAFAARLGLDFPIVHDADGQISRLLLLPPSRSGVLVVNAEGLLVYGFGLGADAEQMASYQESELRRLLHLEAGADAIEPELGLAPAAPPFRVQNLKGQVLTLADLSGRVVVLVFFLPTCPHCHELLRMLDALARQLDRPELAIVPVSTLNRTYVIEDMAQELGLGLTLYTDPDGVAQRDYAHRFVVPDTLVIDRAGRVVLRQSGSEGRVQALLAMQIKQQLDVSNPILLDRDGYSGEQLCGVCHAAQHGTWSLTNHAHAFETLVMHGADRNPECLPCHTVGWDELGGYSLERPLAYLEGVQCENCHGRGGPHQSPAFASRGYEAACATCHTPQHSLRFDFAERLPLVSHAAHIADMSLSLAERKQLLRKRDLRERTLFDPAPYVGSAACQGCHRSEHELWSQSPHARALQTLATRDEAGNPACQRCHTTGFGEPGGWPASGAATTGAGVPDTAGVGCESCHGPGGRHAETGERGSILRLTEKCESCVILQICGSCHDEANDPNFEFELLDKLGQIRHGFRQPKATTP